MTDSALKPRPNRHQMLRAFFPPPPTSGPGVGFSTKGDKEAADAINLRVCEAIITDLIGEFDKGFATHGRGALVINLQTGAKNPHFYSLGDAELDHDAARSAGDASTAGALADLVDQLFSHNPHKAALFLLIDNSRFQLLPIDREYPAAALQQMLKEAQ